MLYANYRVVVGLFLLVSLRKRNGVFVNQTYRISGVDGIKWQAYNNIKGRKTLRAIFTYKRIKQKKTKTYGLVSLHHSLGRVGRFRSQPCPTNRPTATR